MSVSHQPSECFSFLFFLEGRLIVSTVGGEHLVTGATGQVRKGRRYVLGISEGKDELLVPSFLARFALGDYGGTVCGTMS